MWRKQPRNWVFLFIDKLKEVMKFGEEKMADIQLFPAAVRNQLNEKH